MVTRFNTLAALAACALSVVAMPAMAGTVSYDFGSVAGGTGTPVTIGPATFSSSPAANGFTFGPNAGLYSLLGANVLTDTGASVDTLTIKFATGMSAISFNFALGDFLALSGGDTLTLTADTGATATAAASLVAGDDFPEGSFSLASSVVFDEVTITSAFPIVIADLVTVPEPASLALLGAGLFGLAAARRRSA